MTEQEQIKEMAKIAEIELMIHFGDGDIVDPEDRPIQAESIAEAFYKAGYRKAEEVRKETARECLKILHNIGGCDATEDYSRGWDNAINEAYKEIADKYGVTAFEEEIRSPFLRYRNGCQSGKTPRHARCLPHK